MQQPYPNFDGEFLMLNISKTSFVLVFFCLILILKTESEFRENHSEKISAKNFVTQFNR